MVLAAAGEWDTMKTNTDIYWGVRKAAYVVVHDALDLVHSQSVGWDVFEAVWRVTFRAVSDTEGDTVRSEPQHPSSIDFLTRASASAEAP